MAKTAKAYGSPYDPVSRASSNGTVGNVPPATAVEQFVKAWKLKPEDFITTDWASSKGKKGAKTKDQISLSVIDDPYIWSGLPSPSPRKPTYHTNPNYHSPRTQKAKGLINLYRTKLVNLPGVCMVEHGSAKTSTEFAVLPLDGQRLADNYFKKGPVFARPCPKTPRHGFIESRQVNNEHEAMALLCETLVEDPEGEMILMTPIEGKYSAVATNAGITWGRGHDGVTAGRSTTQFTYPFPMSSDGWNLSIHYDPHSFGIKDTAYLELVTEAQNTWAVQLRDGPAQSVQSNFVAKEGEYDKFGYIKGTPATDLMQWEKDIKALIGHQDDTFVWLPGMPLSSHAAVHAIQAGFNVLTDKELPKTETITFTFPKEGPLPEPNYLALCAYLVHWADDKAMKDLDWQAVAFAVATAHAGSVWPVTNTFSSLRAFGIIALARLFTAACLGEVRHWYRQGPGRVDMSLKPRSPLASIIPSSYHNVGDRDAVYEGALKSPFSTLHGLISKVRLDFRQPGWRKSRSFGGRKWADAAEAAKTMIEAIEAFVKEPCKDTWTVLVFKTNIAMNVAHNGGKLLNKWVQDGVLNSLAECPTFGFVNTFAAKMALDTEHLPVNGTVDTILARTEVKFLDEVWGGYKVQPDRPKPTWRGAPDPWAKRYAGDDDDRNTNGEAYITFLKDKVVHAETMLRSSKHDDCGCALCQRHIAKAVRNLKDANAKLREALSGLDDTVPF